MYGRKYMGTFRTTFIIDEAGIIERIIGPKEIKVKNHAEQILVQKPNKCMSVDNNTAQKLIAYAEKYEHPQFLLNDPAQFMHAVKGVKNKEIMAFIASALSYGARSAFIKRLHLLDCTMGVPHDWIISGEYRNISPTIQPCFYRLYSNHLMLSFFDTLRQMIYCTTVSVSSLEPQSIPTQSLKTESSEPSPHSRRYVLLKPTENRTKSSLKTTCSVVNASVCF